MKGFTLIELIVSVAIIMLFSGMGMVYYNYFSEQKSLDQEVKKIVDVLELAKLKSNTADISLCQGASGVTPVVNKYSVVVNPTLYQLVPICLTGTPVPVNYNISNNNQILLTPTLLPTQQPTLAIDFNPLTTQITPACLYIKNTALNKCNYISVDATGNISEGICNECNSCLCPTPIQ